MPDFPFTGAILAGGRSSRMGRDKAFLPFPAPDGPPLIVRQAALLRSLGPADLLISGRPDTDYSLVADARIVLDTVPDSGPLSGLAAVLSAATQPWVLVIAVDLPQMTSIYLEKLLAESRGKTGVVPHSPQGYEPLAALYPKTLLPDVEAALAQRQLSLQMLIRNAVASGKLLHSEVAELELPLFKNWNRPDDL